MDVSVFVLGSAGCGKSSLLKAVGAAHQKAGGHLFIEGAAPDPDTPGYPHIKRSLVLRNVLDPHVSMTPSKSGSGGTLAITVFEASTSAVGAAALQQYVSEAVGRRDTPIFVICYAIDDHASFDHAIGACRDAAGMCRKQPRVLMVGCKSDLRSGEKDCVQPVEAATHACKIGAVQYLEVCVTQQMRCNISTVLKFVTYHSNERLTPSIIGGRARMSCVGKVKTDFLDAATSGSRKNAVPTPKFIVLSEHELSIWDKRWDTKAFAGPSIFSATQKNTAALLGNITGLRKSENDTGFSFEYSEITATGGIKSRQRMAVEVTGPPPAGARDRISLRDLWVLELQRGLAAAQSSKGPGIRKGKVPLSVQRHASRSMMPRSGTAGTAGVPAMQRGPPGGHRASLSQQVLGRTTGYRPSMGRGVNTQPSIASGQRPGKDEYQACMGKDEDQACMGAAAGKPAPQQQNNAIPDQFFFFDDPTGLSYNAATMPFPRRDDVRWTPYPKEINATLRLGYMGSKQITSFVASGVPYGLSFKTWTEVNTQTKRKCAVKLVLRKVARAPAPKQSGVTLASWPEKVVVHRAVHFAAAEKLLMAQRRHGQFMVHSSAADGKNRLMPTRFGLSFYNGPLGKVLVEYIHRDAVSFEMSLAVWAEDRATRRKVMKAKWKTPAVTLEQLVPLLAKASPRWDLALEEQWIDDVAPDVTPRPSMSQPRPLAGWPKPNDPPPASALTTPPTPTMDGAGYLVPTPSIVAPAGLEEEEQPYHPDMGRIIPQYATPTALEAAPDANASPVYTEAVSGPAYNIANAAPAGGEYDRGADDGTSGVWYAAADADDVPDPDYAEAVGLSRPVSYSAANADSDTDNEEPDNGDIDGDGATPTTPTVTTVTMAVDYSLASPLEHLANLPVEYACPDESSNPDSYMPLDPDPVDPEADADAAEDVLDADEDEIATLMAEIERLKVVVGEAPSAE